MRLALDALHAGEESAATLMIANISRQSPFADWKFFIRGLAAYYRDDPETMRGNWDRLGRDLHTEVDPDLCVALGAAVQGALINRHRLGLTKFRGRTRSSEL